MTHETPGAEQIQVTRAWKHLLARLDETPSWQSVFVLGPTGTGKTTLCRFLGRELSQRHRTASIDCDPGQSALGPPACVALAWEPWNGGSPLALRFVRATSPMGHFLQTLTGAKRLAELAVESGAERLVFDSPGYMGTDAGREFQFQMLDLIQPDHLVAVQYQDEMEPLLASFVRRDRPAIHRIPVSEAVVVRSQTERRSYRQKRFARYFSNARPQRLGLDGIGIHGRLPPTRNPQGYINRLAALYDRRGFVTALGIIEGIDLDRPCMQVYAPPFDPEDIASVQLGVLRLNRSGVELRSR